MGSGSLGKIYQDHEMIIKQGDDGDCMYVVQEGLVEIFKETDFGDVSLGLLGKGEFFGEIAIFDRKGRSATVRAVGSARLLTIDKKNFLRRIHEDPSLAFHLAQILSSRIREMSNELSFLRLQSNGNTDYPGQ